LYCAAAPVFKLSIETLGICRIVSLYRPHDRRIPSAALGRFLICFTAATNRSTVIV